MTGLFAHRTVVTPVALLLACGLVIAGHPVAPAAIGITIAVIVLVTTAQYFQSVFAPILYLSSLGSLGMAIGAIVEQRPILSCCLSLFGTDTLLSWPTILMLLFCIVGSRGHLRAYCNWAALPAMYAGMCLAGHYLSKPLTPIFGLFLAMHWTMFFGMVAGHLLEIIAMNGIKSAHIHRPGHHRWEQISSRR
jgi:hypothetical protein